MPRVIVPRARRRHPHAMGAWGYIVPELRQAALRFDIKHHEPSRESERSGSLNGMGDVPPAGTVCPPGYTWSTSANSCQPPQPSLFQRIGGALTGFFNQQATPTMPGMTGAPVGFMQSPMFLPVVVGGGIVAFMLLRKK